MRVLACVLAFATFAGTAMAATLTDRNSFSAPFSGGGDVRLAATGCGTSASGSVQLPAVATSVKVLYPKVGDRDSDSRVTDVRVHGTTVTITAVGDGEDLCKPGPPGDEFPPSTRQWQAEYVVDATYRKRVRALIRTGLDFTPKLRASPTTLPLSRTLTARRMKWKRFGSKKATGRGVLKQTTGLRGFRCTRRVCPSNGKRTLIVASKPGECGNRDVFAYKFVRVYVNGRKLIEGNTLC